MPFDLELVGVQALPSSGTIMSEGGFLYVGGDNYFGVIDVSNPVEPSEVGSLVQPILGMDVKNSHAYILSNLDRKKCLNALDDQYTSPFSERVPVMVPSLVRSESIDIISLFVMLNRAASSFISTGSSIATRSLVEYFRKET